MRLTSIALLTAALALAACADAEPGRDTPRRDAAIGLFTSLPILWHETDDLRDHLRSDAPPHWALAALRERGAVQPINSLLGEGDAMPLADLTMLVMAQPRALAPQENVALDAWVRGGGRLLLFADPMLTEESAFPLGDKRRPQDVVLLSPILDHWKLRLEFDEDQPAGERLVDWGGTSVPVNLPGRLLVAPGSRDCAVLAAGLMADCRLGRGRVLLVADAALLERGRSADPAGGRGALAILLARLAGD